MSLRSRHAPRPLLSAGLLVALTIASGIPGGARAQSEGDESAIADGERLVELLDCNVCHTPKVMTDQGPRPDAARLLSGHPAAEPLPPVPGSALGPEGWGGLFSHGLTAWVGPWGTTFGTNLTPDPETGIGEWTESDFADAIRGGARPPMPAYARLTEAEVHAMFAYLRSIDPVVNRVPKAMPPAKATGDR